MYHLTSSIVAALKPSITKPALLPYSKASFSIDLIANIDISLNEEMYQVNTLKLIKYDIHFVKLDWFQLLKECDHKVLVRSTLA